METLLTDVDALIHLTTFIHMHSDMILRQFSRSYVSYAKNLMSVMEGT